MEKNKQFIENYPWFSECVIQTFDDNKETCDKSLAGIHSVNILETLHKKNEQTTMWVFFSVNKMIKWKRSKDSVLWVNSWIVECDDLSKAEQKKLIREAPIPPSAVVESDKSYHIYYFCEDWKISDWVRINMWLFQYFKWDIKVSKDIARVLRVPWFYHNKWKPYKCECIRFEWTKHKTIDMEKAFPYVEEVVEYKPKPIKPFVWEATAENIWIYLNSLDNEWMLLKLSWTSLVNWEIITVKQENKLRRIYINWKPISAWIDAHWLIWWGCNTWVGWVEWYKNLDYPAIRKWAIENLDIPKQYLTTKKPTKEVDVKKIKKELQEMQESASTNFILDSFFNKRAENILTWGLEQVDYNYKKPQKDDYVYLLWKPWAWKTTYSLFMAIENQKRWARVLYLSLEMNKQTLTDIYIETAWWISEYQREKLNYSEKQEEIIRRFANELSLIDIYDIKDFWEISLAKILELAKGYDMVFVDNFWFIPTWEKEAEWQIEVSKTILNFVNSNQWVCFIMLHHFAKWQDWTQWAVGRGSQKLVDDAFRWITLNRTDEETALIFQKNRSWWTLWKFKIELFEWKYREPFITI